MFSFKKNYNSEDALKKIAQIVMVIGKVLACLCVAAGVIMIFALFGDALEEEFIIIAPLVLVVGPVVLGVPVIFMAHLIWGFGELVGNSRRALVNKPEAQNRMNNGMFQPEAQNSMNNGMFLPRL